jgi:site-specific DNA-methyltransferase (adenine-specific)
MSGKLPENQIICGEALEVLEALPKESVSCCISSPPYWALRDYGVEGQLGLEPTFEEYIDRLCTIYDEVKRVLRKDGCVFVNLGDTYNNTNLGSRDVNRWPKQSRNDHTPNNRLLPANIQVKSLCLIPQRFAIEMVNRGWILRNVIIWHKPNPMPSSAKDRFTVDFEYVYFFVKSKKYFFEPQYEPINCPERLKSRPFDPNNLSRKQQHDGKSLRGQGINPKTADATFARIAALGRNKRCVWTIPTQAFPESHFATFPEALVEPMIKSGCPEFICKSCRKPREKVWDTDYKKHRPSAGNDSRSRGEDKFTIANQTSGWQGNNLIAERTEIGYTDCGCGAEYESGVVLDPFAGSGTTLQVAARLNRNYLGIELNPEYIEMAEKRVLQGETGISPKEQEQGQIPLFGMEAI